jgi:hypothetical protein
MTARFFITIDTEEDDWGEYRSSGFTVENISQIARLQSLFDRYGAIPTYLVTYPVVTSDAARRIFLEILARDRCEIGAHCHPWNTPPFEEEISVRHSMLCNLPRSTVHKKIAVLQNEITQSLGVVPKSFRSGRWGFGADVAAAIQQLGFRVDTSVTPLIDWTMYSGPDYRQAPLCRYQFSPADIQSPVQDGPLLEVPATIGFLQRNYELCRRIIGWRGAASRLHVRGILERAGLVNLRWLSPELSSEKDMLALARISLQRNCSYLNMTFHSTTLLPGRSPYVRTPTDLERFLGSIEKVLEFAVDAGLVFSPLSQAADDIRPAAPAPSATLAATTR